MLGGGRRRQLAGTVSRRRLAFVANLVAAFMIGAAVLVMLFPSSGDDSDPPTCYSVFNWVVPCDARVSVAAGAASSVIAALVLFAAGRRRRR
jgi:hypothetical protein